MKAERYPEQREFTYCYENGKESDQTGYHMSEQEADNAAVAALDDDGAFAIPCGWTSTE